MNYRRNHQQQMKIKSYRVILRVCWKTASTPMSSSLSKAIKYLVIALSFKEAVPYWPPCFRTTWPKCLVAQLELTTLSRPSSVNYSIICTLDNSLKKKTKQSSRFSSPPTSTKLTSWKTGVGMSCPRSWTYRKRFTIPRARPLFALGQRTWRGLHPLFHRSEQVHLLGTTRVRDFRREIFQTFFLTSPVEWIYLVKIK